MSQEGFIFLAVAAYVIGGVLSVVLPYARKYFEGEIESFSWRAVAGKVITLILASVPSLMTTAKASELEVLADNQWLGIGVALLNGLVAFGAATVGHEAQSTPKALRARKASKQ